jgi:hypothetical protein
MGSGDILNIYIYTNILNLHISDCSFYCSNIIVYKKLYKVFKSQSFHEAQINKSPADGRRPYQVTRSNTEMEDDDDIKIFMSGLCSLL